MIPIDHLVRCGAEIKNRNETSVTFWFTMQDIGESAGHQEKQITIEYQCPTTGESAVVGRCTTKIIHGTGIVPLLWTSENIEKTILKRMELQNRATVVRARAEKPRPPVDFSETKKALASAVQIYLKMIKASGKKPNSMEIMQLACAEIDGLIEK